MATAQPPKAGVDEDVDDLDGRFSCSGVFPLRHLRRIQTYDPHTDVLDQFSTEAPKPSTAPAAPMASSSTAPPAPTDANIFSDDFARELAQGMESLMREIGGAAGVEAGKAGDEEEEKLREEAFRREWEKMLAEGMDGTMAGLGDSTGTNAGAGKKAEGKVGDDEFQKNIRAAMQKLKESEDNLRADASTPGADELEKLLAQFGEGKTDEELGGLLDDMMSQLMNKEILYEPLKELSDKFPPYLEEHKATLSSEQLKKYEAQHVSISKIIKIYEDPSYGDSNAAQNAQVVSLMTEMQSYGSPPSEIMGELPPGFDLGPDGLPKMPEGCTIA
ncbi:hypothetical protein EW146_g6368 [Bondarzewia mesenterica]|uniref:Pex19-domain-containing protein n=1 Tax=Bondarzewia mesenterica TaxID=1095465 RepID=A0A4S4LQU3_9AGAM|nr:hypothetical protein EW146_g6368 [Bondarzewia mesenterica]